MQPRIRRREEYATVVAPGEGMRFFRMVRKFLSPHTGTLALLLTTYAAFTVLTALQPLVLAPMLDIALAAGSPTPVPTIDLTLASMDLNNLGQFMLSWLGLGSATPWESVLRLGFAFFMISVGIAVLGFVNYLLALKIKIGAGRDIQVQLFNHLFTLSLDFFNQERIGEIIARLDQDTKNSISGLELSLRNLVVSPLLILYFGYLMFKTNVTLTLFVLAAGVMHYVLTQLIRVPLRQRMFDQFNIAAEVTAYLQERLGAARVVKTFVAETFEALRLRRLVDEVMRVNTRYGFFKNVDEPLTQIINATINVGILLFSASELFAGRLTATGFFLYLFVGRSVLGPLTSLTQSYNSIQSTLAAGVRVRELFDIKPGVVSGSIEVSQMNQALVFEDVTFSYPDTPVLKNVSVEIHKGKTTAIVGPSGSGKSTFTDLLVRFYDPQSGRIALDGKDLRELDLDSYRRLFGVVAQESVLFNATIEENIAYARPETTQAEIEAAARVANAHDFILELPDGYKTYVGDRGVRLSGGQRQRIAIARAVVRKPEILILDEATSSLDTESEKKVQLAVDRAIQSTTAVVIAHRLSTVIRADQIIVLEAGRVVDIGRHNELMARCALYKHLATLQFDTELEQTKVARND
jgi:subfamily B ATP-binding cassette protein MsbA